MPFPPEFDDQLRRLHGQGLSRNQIAQRLGCAVGTVTNHARNLGLTFERTATAAAVEARTIDLKARRQAILNDLYTLVEKDISRVKAAEYSYRIVLGASEFGPSSEVVTDPVPPSADGRNHMTAITGYLTSAIKLEQVDADGGESEVRSMLQRLGEELGIATPQ